MEYQHVLLEIDDPVATITLNRPEKLNALTLRTTDELRHALIEADGNEAVVGIVLTGAGRGFCAGLDLSEIEEMEEAGTTDVSGEACDLTVTKPHHDHASFPEKPAISRSPNHTTTMRQPTSSAPAAI
jgi:enoyl-CoA hydratase/carnithine racemase